MANCILYARFSPRPNSAECESVSKQLSEMREYCAKRKFTIIAEFSDEAMSGSDADRPGLWDAIYSLKRDYLLLVRSWDRLARDSYLAEIIQMQVQKKGCTILSITQESTSQNNPESKLVRTILLAIAEYQRQIIRARTRAAMLRMQKEGRRMCAAHLLPYGRMIDPNNPALMLDNPDEQAIINRIVEWRRDGFSLRSIVDALNDLEIKPRMVRKTFKGNFVQVKGKWNHCLVRSILLRDGKYAISK